MSKPQVPSATPQPVMVLLTDLDLPGSPQTRAKLNKKVAQEYAAAMSRGNAFPPVEVIRVNGVLLVFDGQHRCEAVKLCGQEQILAVVREGTMEEAVRHALQANNIHGQRRSSADKRQAVRLALRTFAALSDHALAELCAVSQTMVSGLRTQLKESFSSASRVGRDGKTRRAPKRTVPERTERIKPGGEFDIPDWKRKDGKDRVARAFLASARIQEIIAEILETAPPTEDDAQLNRKIDLAIFKAMIEFPPPEQM